MRAEEQRLMLPDFTLTLWVSIPCILSTLGGSSFTGEREWQIKRRVASILSKDPMFDKSCRYHSVLPFSHTAHSLLTYARSYLTHAELYRRAVAMTNRVYELRELHKWSLEEINFAFKIIDEPLPWALHSTGTHPYVMHALLLFNVCSLRTGHQIPGLPRTEEEVRRDHSETRDSRVCLRLIWRASLPTPPPLPPPPPLL